MFSVGAGLCVLDDAGRLLLQRRGDNGRWGLPGGAAEPFETPETAALRELREETGIVFPPERFVELGRFDYRSDKALHLYRVDVGATLADLGHLRCQSFFPHRVTGKPTPEADGFRWATRDEVARLCWPRMAARLLDIGW